MEDIIFSPLLWIIFLIIWLLTGDWSTPDPVLDKAPPLRQCRPGMLFADGSTATSKVETTVRKRLEDSRLPLYPPSTAVITYPDEEGYMHKYTPDIIVQKPRVIVEVDPEYTHKGKEKDDARRGLMYEQLGYGVVRIRLGKGLYEIGEYDVWFPQKEWKDFMLDEVLSSIRKARPSRHSMITWRSD